MASTDDGGSAGRPAGYFDHTLLRLFNTPYLPARQDPPRQASPPWHSPPLTERPPPRRLDRSLLSCALGTHSQPTRHPSHPGARLPPPVKADRPARGRGSRASSKIEAVVPPTALAEPSDRWAHAAVSSQETASWASSLQRLAFQLSESRCGACAPEARPRVDAESPVAREPSRQSSAARPRAAGGRRAAALRPTVPPYLFVKKFPKSCCSVAC